MRDETQASRLEKLVRKHPLFRDYTLMLPPVEIKRSDLKSVHRGDVIVLPIHSLKLELWYEGSACATALMESCGKGLRVTKIVDKKTYSSNNSKKYELLFSLFGSVQSREIKEETRIDIGALDMQRVELRNADRKIAQGRLVRAGDQIAIEIEKVE